MRSGKKVEVRELSYVGSSYGNLKEPKDWYAIMIPTTVGDTIYAARRGRVTRVEFNSKGDITQGLTYSRSTNFLTIEQEDCTFADYRLFQENGIFVEAGEQVERDSPLGLSEEKTTIVVAI